MMDIQGPHALQKQPIVFFGDSIYQCYELNHYYPELNIVNRGIGGDTVQGLLHRVKSQVISLKPAKIFILIGTNDLGYPDLSPNQIIKDYKNLIQIIKHSIPTIIILIQSILPTNPLIEVDYATEATRIQKNSSINLINHEMRQFCLETGCIYIDVAPSVMDSQNYLKKEYTEDGLHLNTEGYNIMNDVLKPFILD